jgi:hypothetical protein
LLEGPGGEIEIERDRERERESWYSRVNIYVAGLNNPGSIAGRNRVFLPQRLEHRWIPS